MRASFVTIPSCHISPLPASTAVSGSSVGIPEGLSSHNPSFTLGMAPLSGITIPSLSPFGRIPISRVFVPLGNRPQIQPIPSQPVLPIASSEPITQAITSSRPQRFLRLHRQSNFILLP